MRQFLLLISFFCSHLVFAQQDSISLTAVVGSNFQNIEVTQKIVYHNKTDGEQYKIKLLNWIAAYKNKGTSLSYRKLEDRKSDLYFSTKENLGELRELNIIIDSVNYAVSDLSSENIYINLNNTLSPGKSLTLNLKYKIKLPLNTFTNYGYALDEVSLKYFFLVPDSYESKAQEPRQYQDVEEHQNAGAFWNVNLQYPPILQASSNLNKISDHLFTGELTNDPEFFLTSRTTAQAFLINIDEQNISIKLGYALTQEERANLEFYLPLHLQFIKERIGYLPAKIFISDKFKRKEDFFGNDDIKFWKFKFQLFTDAQKTDLDYFSIISKNILEQSFITEKIKDHWFKNGLKTYLEIEYLKNYYKDSKLLGKLPEEVQVFGLKPLNLFYASDLKLIERYGLAYNYIAGKNLDQKITSPYTVLSNFNDMAISKFEMGTLFNFVAEKMGTPNFNYFLKEYFKDNLQKKINTKDFLNQLVVKSEGSSQFIETFIQHKNRSNFNLKSFTKNGENYDVRIKKNTKSVLPFKLETEKDNGTKQTYFFDSTVGKSDTIYTIPQQNADKIVLNDSYIFPESSYRDNYIYTKGLFSNMKRIKFKLLQDIPNPEYNEIYVNPKLTFNAYDKILLGINFKNKSLFDQQFIYSFTPYYSTGTKDFAGSGGVSYSFMPPESFYQNLSVGLSGSYFHYDFDLAYQKFTASANMSFTKNPRSTVSRNLGVSYSYFNRDLDPKRLNNNDYNTYDLFSLGYSYGDSKLIHEKYLTANVQTMRDFQKISGEFFYRYEFAQNKKVSVRFFGGYFLTNNTRNNLFDYGISRLSNYSFSYGLLGQSATDGILSQQFILAEGGFKSYIGRSVNQWITSVNVDSHVWKMFNVYADAGVYKNKFYKPEFIWDSGVKVKIIPDFLEVYLPVQSSLGFEPSFKDYGKRIRFTLILNFSAISNYFRRGWY